MSAEGGEGPKEVVPSSVVGDVVKVADSSIMQAVFGRSAKALGDYLGEMSEEYFRRLRRQRAENIAGHEAHVVEVTGERIDTNPMRYVAIERWVRLAADVPLSDAELSAITEATLAELGADRGVDYQEVAEKLTTVDARVFLNAPSKGGIAPDGEDRYSFDKLQNLGVARRLDFRRVLVLVSAWLLGTAIGVVLLKILALRFWPLALSVELFFEMLAISAVALIIGISLNSTKYWLTEFGSSMQRSALRFYPKRFPLKRTRLLSPVPTNPAVWALFGVLFAVALPPILERYPASSTPPIILTPPPINQGTASPPGSSGRVPEAVPPGSLALKREDISILIDVWASVAEQSRAVVGLAAGGDKLIADWSQLADGNNRVNLVQSLQDLRSSFTQRRRSLASLLNLYRSYPDVRAALEELDRSGNPFERVDAALESFARELAAVSTTSSDFGSHLRPYAGALKGALYSVSRWADKTGNFAQTEGRQLAEALK